MVDISQIKEFAANGKLIGFSHASPEVLEFTIAHESYDGPALPDFVKEQCLTLLANDGMLIRSVMTELPGHGYAYVFGVYIAPEGGTIAATPQED